MRWALWLGSLGAGVGMALGAAHGVATADTESSSHTGPSSQSTESGAPTSGQPTKPAVEDRKTGADAEAAAVPPSTGRRSAAVNDTDTDAALTRASDTDVNVTSDTEPTDADKLDVAVDTADGSKPASESATTAPQDTTSADLQFTEPQPSLKTETITQPTSAKPAIHAVRPRSTVPAVPASAAAASVTGVQTGRAELTIPVGPNGYATRADWYVPTQADGSVSATGVVWLQHGFLGSKSSVSRLARTLSQQTNSIVVAPNIASFPLACSGCWVNGVPMQEAVAAMFLGDRTSLTESANEAGYTGSLPQDFVMSGQSAGGGFAAAVGGYYAADTGSDSYLRGVMMFDGFSFNGVVRDAVSKLNDPFVPVYQIAAPPQPWNSNAASTRELVSARPGQFVGATLAFGSHADALVGGNPIFDFFAQLVTGFSPPGNTEAVYTLATGWINDMYRGLGPADGVGIYGAPGEYIVMGDAAAIVLGPPPTVDLSRYLGTWYEVGSVKQFFSIGLVNTTAVYSPNPDGSIKVENSGNYYVNDGPRSTIVGAALPVDPTNNKLTVRFFGPASADPPGNYWIVDLGPGYQWAIVTDSTGRSGFLLSRNPVVSNNLYRELLNRASVNGVKGRITPTRQSAAGLSTSA